VSVSDGTLLEREGSLALSNGIVVRVMSDLLLVDLGLHMATTDANLIALDAGHFILLEAEPGSR